VKALPIAGAIAIVCAAARADGEGLGVIAAGRDRAAVAAALVDAIGPRGRVVGDAIAAARAELAAGAVPVATLAAFRAVRQQIDDGWRAYLRAQLDDAQRQLAAARREAVALVALPGGAELYADAALRLGAVLQHRRAPEAAGVLALALALDPERPVTLAEFSPDVVEAVDAVRAAPRASAHLRVTARPADAMIAIDGAPAGRAPLDVPLGRGPHVLVARAPLHRPAVQDVELASEATAALALDDDPDALALAAGAAPGMPAPAAQAVVDAALRFGDLDAVIVATVSDRHGSPALVVQRCGGLPARCTAAVEIGYGDASGLAAAARQAWRAAEPADLRYPPTILGERVRAPATAARWYRSPYVWAGAGAVVLGAVITAVAISGSRPPPVVVVDGGGF
jgi:hypothetical protein